MKRKMHKKTKKLFIISTVCIALGIAFVTCGILKGPSTFFYFDKGKLVTSNQQELYTEKKQLPAFSSIDLSLLTGPCTIKEGDTFSIEYKSHYPGVKPIIAVEDGTLEIKMEHKLYDQGMTLMPSLSPIMEEENYIIITVPAQIKLATIELTADWVGLISIERLITLENINAENLILQYNAGNWTQTTLTNCTFDRIEGTTAQAISLNKVKAGTIALEYEYWREGVIVDEVSAEVISLKEKQYIAEQVMNGDRGDEARDIAEMTITRSTFGKLSFLGGGLHLKNVTSADTDVYCAGHVEIEASTLTGATTLRALGDISVDTTLQEKLFNYDLKRAQGYVTPLIVELADFDTPEYNEHGFNTEQSKVAGQRWILVTEEQYAYLLQARTRTSEWNEREYDSFPLTEDFAKFRGSGDLKREYVDDKELPYVQVQNKKTVAYYMNAQGQRIYMNEVSNVKADITVNGKQVDSQILLANNGAPNQMSVHSSKGFVHITFAE